MKRTTLIAVAAVAMLVPAHASSQLVFHSMHSANIPTAAMLAGGNGLFEISHRFDTPMANGADDLWGFDGPVFNRLGFAYAPSDQVTLGVQRSNRDDNLELYAKLGGAGGGTEALPVAAALMGGVAWNTQVFPTGGATDNEMQAYGQLIANTVVGRRLALGVVPTLVYNPRLLDVDKRTAFALGLNAQFYLTPHQTTSGRASTGRPIRSFFVEWIVSEAQVEAPYDSGTVGFEIRTRGHFFKLVITNQARMNPTQFLGGAAVDFLDPDNWRMGFNITRIVLF